MHFSRQLTGSLGSYLLKKKLAGWKRYPLVLMLEPLFRCNLRCAGCGRIREYGDILDRTLSLEECLSSVEEAGAPVVSLTGGEPLLHPQVAEIVKGIIEQKRFINLCTNGLLLEESLAKFEPSPHLSFVVHLDGLADTHNKIAGRKDVFETAVSALKAAVLSGHRVVTNTTIYKQTDINEISTLFRFLAGIPVNGLLVTPAFSYRDVDADFFLSREDVHRSFEPLYRLQTQVPFYHTPLYLDFLTGRLDLKCVPWSTPTRNPKGWKKPCYLITDGHCNSFKELMQETDWTKYGAGNDPRCADCMVHCGFEAGALAAMGHSLPNLWKTARSVIS